MPTLISLRFTTHTFYTLLPIVSTNTIEIDYLRPRKRRRCGLVWTSENEGLKLIKALGIMSTIETYDFRTATATNTIDH